MTTILAVDTGGTFTDLAVYDTGSATVSYAKTLTTYDDLSEGVVASVRKVGTDLAVAEIVKFGTTLVINTYVQRNGARTALVTTSGFRDSLEIRRGNRSIPYDLRHRREPALVARDHRFEISARQSSTGTVLRPVSQAEVVALAAQLRALEVEAVAVSLINAYVDPAQEEAVIGLLREELPGVYLTAGNRLSREWGEYERTATAVANAYVGPAIENYVDRLGRRLAGEGLAKPFFLMASNGGVFSKTRACAMPVMLVESGPAGGCIGASVYAAELGLPKVIAFDMGGTTAKCAVIDNAQFDVRSPYYVGGEEFGFPVSGNVIDIIEVGAGGGSIASVDTFGKLSVGPRSAGSTPGPICYAKGGRELTITDANLVLGRIDASSFLGGEMSLDKTAAETAMAALADRLGMTGDTGVMATAQGILTLGGVRIGSAIKQITTERGLDPRDFAMIAFGGGGPLHTAALARELGIRELIIPPEPGNFCALGMLLAPARTDEVQTFLRTLEPAALDEMAVKFDEMERLVAASMTAELGESDLEFIRQADLCFAGQVQSLRVAVTAPISVDIVRNEFERAYRRRYGHVHVGAAIQFVNLVLSATAAVPKPNLKALRPNTQRADGQPIEDFRTGTRKAYFAERGALVDCAVFRREQLPIGAAGDGPAIIEEYGSSTVIGPQDRFQIGELGEVRIWFPAPEEGGRA